MPRISIDQVEKMKQSGALILEAEKVPSEPKVEPKKTSTVRTTGSTTTINIFSDVKRKSKIVPIQGYEDIVNEVTKLKDKLNNLIDSVNNEDEQKVVKSLMDLLRQSAETTISFNIDGQKAWKESLKVAPDFKNNLGTLPKIFHP